MNNITLLGLTASPYQLKMQAMADYSTLHWQRWPDQSSTFNALRALSSLGKAKRRKQVKRYPNAVSELDEYPSVPYYSFDNREFFYDSSAMAVHLDALGVSRQPLLPIAHDQRFVCQLIDEAFDEFGLYMVHHNRWVTSASTNRMGEMTASEMHSLIPRPFRGRMARKLAKRQAGRCPYLFSVAPEGFDAGVAAALTPPAREGFPATHQMLDQAWRLYLQALEDLLSSQPYILGDRFTLADASAYGQLSMNLVDGRAADLLQELAPGLYAWLCIIRDGGHKDSCGDLYLSNKLQPLLQCIATSFIPLMQQNEAAYQQQVTAGQTLFNEAAFDKGEALYDGKLMGLPFRAVVKTFQVSTWRELRDGWNNLDSDLQSAILSSYPQLDKNIFEGKTGA